MCIKCDTAGTEGHVSVNVSIFIHALCIIIMHIIKSEGGDMSFMQNLKNK